MAGDFSPLTIEAGYGGSRIVPPALLVAMALGLGSIDMPIPSVDEWEWLNWKFPRPVHAGDTIYARWVLTQKRPPVGSAPSSIAVWRVDVLTGDGVLCAEGEVGASVRRRVASAARPQAQEPAGTPAAIASRRRRGRRRPATGGNGPKTTEGAVPLVEPPAAAAPPASAAKPERSAGPTRRRRRRRSPGSAAARNGDGATASPSATQPIPPAPEPAPVISAAKPASQLSRVIRRLRRT